MIDFKGLGNRTGIIEKFRVYIKTHGMQRAQRIECIFWTSIICAVYRFFGWWIVLLYGTYG